MSDEAEPPNDLTQTCSTCGALLDVSEEEPLASVHCPMCGSAVTIERSYNHFAVREILGRGGMGAVYKAEDSKLKRMVALKILRRDIGQEAEHREQLENEARITASINHPHVVKVYTFGEAHGQFYLAMELVDKGSLDDLMGLQNRVAEAQVLEVGIQVAQGLRAASEAGLIHRDVKPGNILFADPHTAKIVDFGLALLMEKEAEARGEVWGTPYYIAPEKLNHEAEDFRSDMYSLGATLFHAVAGRPPFEAESANLVALKHIKSRAVSLQAFAPEVSSETSFVINRMLHRNPDDRYATYDELIEHLQFARDSLQEKLQHPRKPKQRVTTETDFSKKIMGALTLFTLFAILATIGVFVFLAFGDKEKANAPNERSQVVLTVEDFRESLSGTMLEQYDEGMRLLQSGRFKPAEALFRKLADNSETPQPALNWFRLMGATAAMFSGQRGNAYPMLQALSEDAVFSTAKADLPLADLFRRAGLLTDTGVITPDEVESFQTPDGQSLLILLAGLNNWHSGYLEDGAKLLTAFVAIDAEGQLSWINSFHEPAQKMIDQRERVLDLEKQAEAVDSEAALDEISGELEALGSSLPADGALQVEIDRVQRFIETKKRVLLNLRHQAEERRLAELRAAEEVARQQAEAERQEALETEDTPRWQQVLEATKPMMASYQYEQALQTMTTVSMASSAFQKRQDQHQDRLKHLAKFIIFIKSNLSQHPYQQMVTTKSGSRFPNLSGFDAGVFFCKTPYGRLEVEPSELHPKTLLNVAQFQIEQLDPADRADALLHAAYFATENGLIDQGRTLADAAVQADGSLQEVVMEVRPLLSVHQLP